MSHGLLGRSHCLLCLDLVRVFLLMLGSKLDQSTNTLYCILVHACASHCKMTESWRSCSFWEPDNCLCAVTCTWFDGILTLFDVVFAFLVKSPTKRKNATNATEMSKGNWGSNVETYNVMKNSWWRIQNLKLSAGNSSLRISLAEEGGGGGNMLERVGAEADFVNEQLLTEPRIQTIFLQKASVHIDPIIQSSLCARITTDNYHISFSYTQNSTVCS